MAHFTNRLRLRASRSRFAMSERMHRSIHPGLAKSYDRRQSKPT